MRKVALSERIRDADWADLVDMDYWGNEIASLESLNAKWEELARKHEDSADHYARRCYDLEALNAELVEAFAEIRQMAESELFFTHRSASMDRVVELCDDALAKARGEA